MIKTFVLLTAFGLIHAAEKSLTEPSPNCPSSGHGLLPHEYDCTKFYHCTGGRKFVAASNCPAGTEFSVQAEACTDPSLANCKLPVKAVASSNSNAALTSNCVACDFLENGCPADFSVHLLLPHETSCRKFYYCVNGQKVESTCRSGSVFNPAIQNCGPPGSIDRTCEDEDSSEEDIVVEDDKSSEEVLLLPNGCPVDWTIPKHLPHTYYCNKYFQCIHGVLFERRCASGTHFNPETGNCDHPHLVRCTLPGGDAESSEEVEPDIPPTAAPPSIDFLENGCPVDGSITWHVPHADDCSKFYQCVWGSLIEMSCSGDLHFSPTTQTCESPAIAGCICAACEDKSDCSGEESSEEDPIMGDDDTSGCNGDDCNNDCTGDDCNNDCTGNDCNNDCTGNDCNNDCTGDDCNNDCTGNDCNNDCTGDDCNNECTGDDCNNDCTGNDCNNDCTGDDCNNECTGDDCNNDCTGDDCNNDCTGDDCNNDCTGDDCNNECTGDDCNNDCTGNDCNNDCTGDDCNNECTGNDCNNDCTGDDCNNDCTGDDCNNGCNGNDCNASSSEEDLPVADDQNDPNCVDPEEVNRCEEECNVLPWAHDDCDKFWQCKDREPVVGVCSEGLHFNPNTYTCDFACNVGCVRETIQATRGDDGLRVYIPWSQINSKTIDLLKMIAA